MTNTKEAVEDDEINLIDYLIVIFKYWRMILLICGVVVVMTVITSLLSPKVYSATTTIVPPVEVLQAESELARQLRSSMLRKAVGVTSIAYMYTSILQSRAVVDGIIDRFDLMKVYGEKECRTSVSRKLRENTAIKVSDESIVKITVEDTDPNRAAAMANAYVEELDRQNKRLSSGQATSKRIFLENRLVEIEEKLSRIDNILSREAKIQEMLFELLTREYEIAKIEEVKSMPTIQILDRAIVPEVRVPRDTKTKTLLAGGVSFVLAVFVAFAREHFARMGNDAEEQEWRLLLKPRQQSSRDSAFSEFESKRRIVAAQRKRPRENKLYSQRA